MKNWITVLVFSAGLLVLTISAIALFHWYERKKQLSTTRKFQAFSNRFRMRDKELRTVPRIRVPDTVDVVLSVSSETGRRWKGRLVDVSLNGFTVVPESGLRRISLEDSLEKISVQTPINRFRVERAKLLRVEQRTERKILALRILHMKDEQFAHLKDFISYLEKFLNDRD